MPRVFSQEDGQLEKPTIISSRERVYKDVDLTFTARSMGDVFKKTDAAAVKQSIKNLLLTNHGDKPFTHYYGGNLNSFLFLIHNNPLLLNRYLSTTPHQECFPWVNFYRCQYSTDVMDLFFLRGLVLLPMIFLFQVLFLFLISFPLKF